MNDRAPEILLAGTSHRVAGIARREPLAAAVRRLAANRRAGSAIAESFVLATCHRTEIYVVTDNVDAAARELDLFDGVPAYCLAGEDAVHHLCRVTAGLDSLILGEAEISGQVRRAAAAAREDGSLGPYLDRVIAGALRAGGRARSETRIGEGAMSAGAAAVALADRLVGGLDGHRALVIGAGEAARQALARLARYSGVALTIASRSAKHARDAAAAFAPGAQIVGLDGIARALDTTDAVISAVHTPSPIVNETDVLAAMATRRGAPIVFVDISMPRAIDPSAASVNGAILRTVDDLGDVVAEVTARRRREVPRVEAIVRDEAARAYHRFLTRARRQCAAVA